MQLRVRITLSFFPVILLFFMSGLSCTHEPVGLNQLDTICFESQVLPLLQNSCGTTGCHDGLSGAEGFDASNYETILRAVDPGYPKKSRLYEVLTNIWGENFMPPDNPLSKENRNIIQVWIAQGALKTTCNSDTSNGNPPENPDTICFVQDILPVFQSGCALINCHDATTHTEGYNLSDYTSIMSNEEGIVPYSPGSSEIFEVITKSNQEERMPPPPWAPLTAKKIENIRTWILDGAPNSDCPQNTCDTLSTISFSNQVFPIIENNCLSCHNSSTPNAGISLNNYQNISSIAEIERNNVSFLVGVINSLPGFAPMPPFGPLDPCSIRTIELWIEQGYENN